MLKVVPVAASMARTPMAANGIENMMYSGCKKLSNWAAMTM